MKILVACEESQTVLTELLKREHDAWSCDILPTSGPHPERHLQCDVTPLLNEDWDMIFAFPPCTDLAISGSRHFKQKIADGRQQASIDFFLRFTDLKCERVVIENPVGIMSSRYRKPDQIIQPYEHGEPFSKRTCLWLKGVAPLIPSNIVEPTDFYVDSNGHRYSKKISHGTANGRGRRRSKFPGGIAVAMADQWCRVGS